MTKEEIDILWNKAIRESIDDGSLYTRYRFAELVAEAEREACAKVCDETLAQHYMKQTIPARDESLLLAACADCAAAIRARGETK